MLVINKCQEYSLILKKNNNEKKLPVRREKQYVEKQDK